jgi:hypothetical protein
MLPPGWRPLDGAASLGSIESLAASEGSDVENVAAGEHGVRIPVDQIQGNVRCGLWVLVGADQDQLSVE